jgi:hypothetical protein
MGLVVGIDLDNTIVTYDALMQKIAAEEGLLLSSRRMAKKGASEKSSLAKKHIRDGIRRKHGDLAWQRVQALAYGERMPEAQLVPGVRGFLKKCREQAVKVYIISHKTKFSSVGKVNLREAATKWLRKNLVMDGKAGDNDALGLSMKQVFFESSREEKLWRIASIGCTHFIDDLEETFLEPSFPIGVQKLLYAPHKEHGEVTGMSIFSDWKGISEYFFSTGNGPDERKLRTMLTKALGRSVSGLTRIGGGRNTRTYRFESKKHVGKPEELVAKLYFRHASDKRDRLSAEYKAFEFLWNEKVRSIPRPVLSDSTQGLAIYSFVNGEKIEPDSVTTSDIDAATEFLIKLDRLKNENMRSERAALTFPPAADACFCAQDILDIIERRFTRLSEAARSLPSPELEEFLKGFAAARAKVAASSERQLASIGQSLAYQIPEEHRTLSPSDFGFHNALRLEDGTLVFLDFEYFGWDDPAKMVCDFLLHPGMRLDKRLKLLFSSKICAHLAARGYDTRRISAVYPLFGLVWCLILLNEFVPEHLLRRKFAAKQRLAVQKLQAAQLLKAREMLATTQAGYGKR